MASCSVRKRYGDDWAKSKSRDLVRDMVSKNLLLEKKPVKLKVLCFPGIDLAEVVEVYDSIGIPRGNITGIERDNNVADKIEESDAGINLIRGSLEDLAFTDQMPVDLDIISLDYTGLMSNKSTQSLSELLSVQRNTKLIVHSANLMKRDRQNYWAYNFYGSMTSSVSSSNITGKTPEVISESIISQIRKNNEDIMDGREESIRDSRSLAYSAILRNILIGVVNNSDASPIFKFVRDFPGLARGYADISDVELMSIHLPTIVKNAFLRMGITDQLIFSIIHNGLLLGTTQSPISRIDDFKSYSYVSESGAPMMGDIYFLVRDKRLKEQMKSVVGLIGYPHKLQVRNFEKLRSESRKMVSGFYKFAFSINKAREDSENRIYLGSSARPVLTKQKAIDEFISGATVEEVRAKYRGVNGKPIAQWKAHVTMGTYESNSLIKEGELKLHEEDSDLEKITKEDAIDLLSSGIPVKEVYNAYPTSFSEGQLRAFKAHVTMKTYGGKYLS